MLIESLGSALAGQRQQPNPYPANDCADGEGKKCKGRIATLQRADGRSGRVVDYRYGRPWSKFLKRRIFGTEPQE